MTARRPRLFLLALFLALLGLTLAPPPAGAAGDWSWPVRGDVITPYRNGDDPYASGQHRGIDIAAPVGEPVVAAVAGSVTYAGTAGSSGLTVNVRTADGEYDTSYLHLSSLAVGRGDRVTRGQRLGAVGVSGTSRSAERPHLHFGVRRAADAHAYLDPLRFLPAPPPPARPVPPAPVAGRAPEAAPPASAPAPVAAPSPRRVRVPATGRVPRRRPAPSRRPLPRTRGFERPRVAPRAHGPRPRPTLEPLPAPRPTPATRARREVNGSGDGVAVPGIAGRAPASGSSRAPSSANSAADAFRAHETSEQPGRRPAGRERGKEGLDLGWVAACVGLIVVASILAHPAKQAARPGRRSLIATLLKPLANRG